MIVIRSLIPLLVSTACAFGQHGLRSPQFVAELKPALSSPGAPAALAWIVSTNISPLAANGGNVTNVTDLSGNGYTFSFYNATPSYFTNGPGGKPYILFGTGTYLTNSSLASSFAGSDVAWSAVIVAKKGSPSGTMFQFGSKSSSNPGHAISGEFSNWRVWRRDDGGTMADINTGAFNTDWMVFSMVFTGTQVSLYTNSVAVFTGQSQDVGTMTIDTAVIGGRTLGGTFSSVWDGGSIAEVKIWNSALSDSARGSEETALRTKYGL